MFNRLKRALQTEEPSVAGSPTAPLPTTLPEPLPHQFRHRVVEQWEADFTTMTLSVSRSDGLMISEEPVLYELSATEDGALLMRLNDESRQVMVANIESRLADHRAPYRAADEKRDREKLAELHTHAWRSIPLGFSLALHERYSSYLRQREA